MKLFIFGYLNAYENPPSQHKTMIESDQNTTRFIGNSKCDRTLTKSCSSWEAAQSSNRGMVILLSGDLLKIRLMMILSWESLDLRRRQAPYPVSNASHNPWISVSTTLCGTIRRYIEKSHNSGRCSASF